jgi:hypothetical protein
MRLAPVFLVLAGSSARADQFQADLGLTVVAAGYEQPAGERVAVTVEAGLFGTYFLPWFDLGDDTIGAIGGVRTTWFQHADMRGLYVAPYLRAGYVTGEHEGGVEGIKGDGAAVTAGAFVGWAFPATKQLDIRIGGGAQYIYISGSHGLEASTPFVALDLVVSYRRLTKN